MRTGAPCRPRLDCVGLAGQQGRRHPWQASCFPGPGAEVKG